MSGDMDGCASLYHSEYMNGSTENLGQYEDAWHQWLGL